MTTPFTPSTAGVVRSRVVCGSRLLLLALMLVGSPTSSRAQSTKLLGAYYAAPGGINFRVDGCAPCDDRPDPCACGILGCGWPPHLSPHPVLGQYDSGVTSTINYLLDRAAALGIDFLVVDESNGIFLPCNTPPLQSDLQSFMDIVDQRINAGIRTPLITTMAHSVDANWIWDALVYKNGVRRPGWFWYSGRPFLGVYSAHPFRTDFQDARYFIRYIANSASCVENGQGKCVEPWKSECKQAQKDLGNVWCWATVGQTAPLFSPSSEEITIQNGYSNVVACLDYWDNCEQSQISTQGFTADYYHSQWTAAVQHNPQIIVITSFGGGAGIEGGQIEARTDFQPPTLFEGLTLQRAQQWKGSLMTCGLFALNESLLPGQSWVSCDGVTRLIHQQDGNAVLYRLVGCNWSPIWSTDTFGRTTSRLVMQPNGNLVLYSQSNNVLWSSHTAGHPGAFLRVQDDCNMVVYGPGNEGALWSSGTSGLC